MKYIIYVDGSINNSTQTSGSSAILYDFERRVKITKTKKHTPGTNNTGELIALQLANDLINRYLNKKDRVFIIGDSKYAINTTESCLAYYKKHRTFNGWKKTDGSDFSNKELIIKIVESQINRNIIYVHMNSHVSKSNADKIRKIKNKLSCVGLRVTDESIYNMIDGNKLADELAYMICH